MLNFVQDFCIYTRELTAFTTFGITTAVDFLFPLIFRLTYCEAPPSCERAGGSCALPGEAAHCCLFSVHALVGRMMHNHPVDPDGYTISVVARGVADLYP